MYHLNYFKMYSSVVLIKYIHIVVQPISPVLHLAKLETLCPLNTNSPFPLPPSPWQPPSTFCPYETD